MKEVQDPIQEQLVAARRKQILDAATEVFAEKGFHTSTIRDVARAAGVADGTIYNYFDNKDALLLGILSRLNETEQRPQHFEAAAGEDFRAFFTAYLRHRLGLMLANLRVFQALLPEILGNAELRDAYYRQLVQPTLAMGERFFQAQVDRGEMRPADLSLAVRALAASTLGLLLLRIMGDPELIARWDDLPEALADLFFDGLAGKQ